MVDNNKHGSEHPGLTALSSIARRVSDRKLAKFIDYWKSIHPADRLPSRADFDPMAIPDLLPQIVLMDVEDNPRRFRFRVFGSELVDAFEHDFTNLYTDEIPSRFRDTVSIRQRFEVAETGLPIYYVGNPSLGFTYDFAPVEIVHLPMARDGETPDMIISMFVHYALRRSPDGSLAH